VELPPDSSISVRAAQIIWGAFLEFHQTIHTLMQRAPLRFEAQDWRGLQADAIERLDAPEQHVQAALHRLAPLLAERLTDRKLWANIKQAYAELCVGQPAAEIAKTLYTTVTRRVFKTIGTDAEIEFRGAELDVPANPDPHCAFVTVTSSKTLALARACLRHAPWQLAYDDFETQARRVARVIDAQRMLAWGDEPAEAVDLLKPIFYRNQAAYIVGRVCNGPQHFPLVIALRNLGQRLSVDAVLLDENDVSMVFSFTRSYFHVDLVHTFETVQFLRSLMPLKRVAELYMSLGYPRHGKTELYRDLLKHLERSSDQFIPAPGDRGMVMAVFTLPSYDMVFKVIRDKFAEPKTTTRQDVLDKYALVFKHDRAGRLVDAQEFRQLAFPRHRFAPQVIEELMSTAASSVIVCDDEVVLKHVYAERRMTPLNLYLRQAPPAEAVAAARDYGQAIRDLAHTNIFPGDLLLKNFGVTRHGRVIFYDYDELCLVTECVFRDLPQAGNYEDEVRGEPWFYVSPNDIFPEEFMTFIGLQGEQRQAFIEAHGDLLHADFWRKIQTKHTAGQVLEVRPYSAELCLQAEPHLTA
jgi:isocitrate dehydrogenase kinase/phosphatase